MRQIVAGRQSWARPIIPQMACEAWTTDDDAEGESIRSEIKRLDAKISRLSDLLSETTSPESLIRKIEEFENQRNFLDAQLEKLEVTRRQSKAMQQIKESDVKAMLEAFAENLVDLDREALKDLLGRVIDRITFDHSSLARYIYYKIKLNLGELMASPRGFLGNSNKCLDIKLLQLKKRIAVLQQSVKLRYLFKVQSYKSFTKDAAIQLCGVMD